MASIAEALAIARQHYRSGNLAEAEQICQQVIQFHPSHGQSLHLLGMIASQQGRFDAAIDFERKAILNEPANFAFHNNLGYYYHAVGSYQEAISSYQRALAIRGDSPEVYNNLGNALLEQKRFEEAIASYQQALHLKPSYPEAHNNLGNAFTDIGKLDEAERAYRRALQLWPDYPQALSNLGNVLTKLERPDEAVRVLQQAVQIRPDYAQAYSNLGIALEKLGKYEAAVSSHQQAARLQPGLAKVHINLGIALADQGKLIEALASYQQALEADPQNAEAHWSRGLIWMLQGRLVEGWPEYEWRWRSKELSGRSFDKPRWDGSALNGCTILLHAEQGLGDTLQFIRYAPLVKGRGARVIVECQEPLLDLLATCAGIDDLIPRNSPLPSFDVHAPLLSLPGLFGTDLTNIPANVPYLQPPAELAQRWKQQLGDVKAFKIGIVWQGSRGNKGDAQRSVPLEFFADLCNFENMQLFSLQKGPGSEQLAGLQSSQHIIDLGSRFATFADTAAALVQLDLVITVDTSVAHCAGALGIPTWVALPFAPDWRWMLDREDSPWYPTMRLFRQTSIGNWDDVFDRISRELQQLVSKI